jgi:hypothetical protein
LPSADYKIVAEGLGTTFFPPNHPPTCFVCISSDLTNHNCIQKPKLKINN